MTKSSTDAAKELSNHVATEVVGVIRMVPLGHFKLYFTRNNWIKGILIAGGLSGFVFISSALIRRWRRKPDTPNPKYLAVNGHGPKAIEGDVNISSVSANSLHGSEGRSNISEFGEFCVDFPFPSSHSRGGSWSVSRSRVSTLSSVRRRRRSGSTASVTNASIRIPRSPSELMNYSLESMKRAVLFLEESKVKLQECQEGSIDSEFEFILCKAKQLIDDVDEYRRENTPEKEMTGESAPIVNSSVRSIRGDLDNDSLYSFYDDGTVGSTATLPFYDIEPNIHFFKFYTQALDNLESITPPRVDRTLQLELESETEFIAKVHCLRTAFTYIMQTESNHNFFADMGRDILNILLSHSLRDPTECLVAYDDFIELVSDPENQEALLAEVQIRRISCLNFYDLVLDYIILDSFDDLDDPPKAVLSVANNRWLSAGFRELALQTAVSAVLRHKRSKLAIPNGFFAHFYNILDHVSPILAWGFLGTDYELGYKCNLIKASLFTVCRDYFSFDRVRYTSVQDTSSDLLMVTQEAYRDLKDKLST